LDDGDFAPGEFDLITIFHVLEHVPDPRAALARLSAWLRPGGHLYVEVPNAVTAVNSPSNLFHRAHLYYFAAEPLAALARSANLTPVLLDGAVRNASLTAVFVKGTSAGASDLQSLGSAHSAVVTANHQQTLRNYLLAGTTLANAVQRLLAKAAERSVERSGRRARETLDWLFESEAPWLVSAGA
jgi:SAM-dependent methyltransferase